MTFKRGKNHLFLPSNFIHFLFALSLRIILIISKLHSRSGMYKIDLFYKTQGFHIIEHTLTWKSSLYCNHLIIISWYLLVHIILVLVLHERKLQLG